MALPPRHVCIYCGTEAYLDSQNTMTLITGWLKNNKSRQIAHVTEKHYKYAHSHCYDQAEGRNGMADEPTLF